MSFLVEMKLPVGIEVSTNVQGTQTQDGLGAIESPPCPGDAHSILDKVAASTFDDAGCNG